MISEKVAAGVVGIMIGLQDFPANEIRRRKLVKAFRSADTEAIAARAISHWVSDSNRCPNPEEIRSIIIDLNAKHREDVGSARAKCVASARLAVQLNVPSSIRCMGASGLEAFCSMTKQVTAPSLL